MNSKLNAVDLFAKLLANENVSVRRARTRSASFDIKSRVLTLPLWKDMSPIVESMLVGHEVGHALYTTEEYFVPLHANPKLMSYLNILEDVRIEKLMKRRYPGIRKTMNAGYAELNEKDYFGVKTVKLHTINLIDRINLYFKAGFACGVVFDSEEKVFVNRAEKTETVPEVIALAHDVYAFSKARARDKIQLKGMEEPEDLEDLKEDNMEYGDPDDLDELDEDSANYDNDDFEESETTPESEEPEEQEGGLEVPSDPKLDAEEQQEEDKSTTSGGSQAGSDKKEEDRQVDEELESITQTTMDNKLAELTDENTQHTYFTLGKFDYDPIVGYKRILHETSEQEVDANDITAFNKFQSNSLRVVNYLVKEFEMKKSATLYKRAQTSKIGSLDMKKVWSYKLNEDLFKRVTTIPQGKNHGMIFLLDWSGSMDTVLKDTIEQVMTLAMFCQRVQIPYQVFAFSSHYGILTSHEAQSIGNRSRADSDESDQLENGTSLALLEFFSSKMSSVEFTTMAKRLHGVWKFRSNHRGNYTTGGTPLNEALAFMTDYIGKYIKTNNIEKMSFITLSDGEGSSLSPVSYRKSLSERTYVSGKSNTVKNTAYLMDPITKKDYDITGYSAKQTAAILQLIKDRYNINSVGFYICRNSRRALSDAMRSNLPGFGGNERSMIDEMRKDFRANGFSSLSGSGRDDLFIIPQNSLVVYDVDVELKGDESARQIAKIFSKSLSGSRTSRVLLNKFIQYVA